MKHFFLPVLLLLPALLSADPVSKPPMTIASDELKAHQTLVTRLELPSDNPGHRVLLLETPFAKAEFITPSMARALSGKVIEKIQLVYTTFAVSASFDQQGLNQRRLKNLYALAPGAFTNPFTEWELVGQTGAHSPEEGRGYFHGFVITWRPDASEELVKTEISMLDSLFGSSGMITGGGKGVDPTMGGVRTLKHPDGTTITLDHDIPEDSLFYYMKPSGPAFKVIDAKYGNDEHTMVIVTELSESGYKRKREWKLEEHKGEYNPGFNVDLTNPDSVVTTVMRRNKWQNMVVVCDVTGSMSPYTAQVFAWIPVGLANGQCKGFFFFNDGDHKSTGSKAIGKTGGIYGINSQRFDSIFYKAKETMRNGDGGDIPENPIEAVITAIKQTPANTEIILIADNYSSPRDLELLEKVKRPIHIILCGARGSINTDYLLIAKKTHGSVHTITQDVPNLDDIDEGEVIEINGKHYRLVNGRFLCEEMFSDYTY